MPEKPQVDISLVVANYNNGRYLSEFIESVIASTLWPRELILVDDGSTDSSLQLLESYRWVPFLKILALKENLGLPLALNAGLTSASCRYIMRADPDDLLLPDRIEKQYNFMEAHPEVSVLGSNVIYFHHYSGKEINISNFPVKHERIVQTYRRGTNGIQHPTAIIRRTAIEGHHYKNIRVAEDYELFATLAREGYRFAGLKEPLCRMRIHPLSSTSALNLKEVRNIYESRDRIWNTHTSEIRILLFYYFIRYYRRSQLSEKIVKRSIYLLLSGICSPSRVIKRLFRF